MTQRFNAPPGWDVPAGFVPPDGWQPDPSWPTPPQDWTWWVEDAAPGAAPSVSGPTATGAAAAAGVGGVVSGAGPGGQGDPYGAAGAQSGGHGGAPYPLADGQQAAPYGQSASPYPGGGTVQEAQADAQLKQARRGAILGAAAFVVGLVVTVVSYNAAGPGEDPRVWWGPMLFGPIIAIVSLVRMSKAKKSAPVGFDPSAFAAGGQVAPGYGVPPGPGQAPQPPGHGQASQHPGYGQSSQPPAGYPQPGYGQVSQPGYGRASQPGQQSHPPQGSPPQG